MISEILKECELKGITLEPMPDGTIKCEPGSRLDNQLIARLRANKGQLLAVLNIMDVFDGTLIEETVTVH